MPYAGESQTIGGKTTAWQPTTSAADAFNYMGTNSGYNSLEEAQAADAAGGEGSWVPASYAHPNGLSPYKIIGLLAAAGALGDGAVAALGGLGGGAAAGGTAAATGGNAALSAALPGTAVAGMGSGAAATGLGVAGKAMSMLGALGKLGGVLNAGAAGAASGREKEAALNLQSDTLRQRQVEADRTNAIDAAKLQSDQRVTGQNLESQARRQALAGSIAQNGPPSFTPPPNVASHMGTSTGLGMPPGMADAGKQAYDAAMQRISSGSDKKFAPLPTFQTPVLTPMPEPSKLSKIMQIAGLITGAAGAFGGGK